MITCHYIKFCFPKQKLANSIFSFLKKSCLEDLGVMLFIVILVNYGVILVMELYYLKMSLRNELFTYFIVLAYLGIKLNCSM